MRSPFKMAKAAAYHRSRGNTAVAESFEAELHAAGRCLRCGATLTDPESIRLGIGPTCRSKKGTP
jgi:hypothetical protein